MGKTTLVGAVSEIRPLRTEELLTEAGRPVDDTSGVEGKHTTTVAMDFGRITLREDLVLYLFGTPGQERFWFMWDELSEGSLGAVVLADTRRLEDCFAALDYFERRSIPFVVGVNCFEGADRYPVDAVRQALDLDEDVPSCSATRATGHRSRRSSSRSSSMRWPTARSAAGSSRVEARGRPAPPPTGVRAAARGTARTRVCPVNDAHASA